MTLQAHGRGRRYLIAAVFGIAVIAACPPARALAADPPHVVSGGDTDTCAMCHRTHTAAGGTLWQDSSETSHNALLASPTGSAGDTGFCYSCHGAEAAGANTDIQSSFRATSHHSVDPSASPYGPSPKQCSDCHDSHGTARTAAGSPYAALLRSRTATHSDVYAGEEYCATCHAARPASRWDGLAVYKQTKHYSAIPTPTTGTGIRCTTCHAPHGSPVAPIIQRFLTPPAVPATVEVTADDRTFCFDCHPSASATYGGRAAYQASAHGLSSKAVTVTGEWPSAETTRAVGECQVCHAPMGRSDGAGGAIPKLAEKTGVALCLTCHTAAGPASTDFAALSYPATASPTEILASWSPPTSTAAYSRLAMYGQDPDATPPRQLIGPRELRLPSAALGAVASGDIDGDGRPEVVAAKPGSDSLALFAAERLRGLAPVSTSLAISSPADLLAVGDFTGIGRAEIAVVSRTDSRLRVYSYSSGGGLSEVGSAVAVDAGANSIATGDVTGTASPDIVVTAGTAGKLDIFSESGGAMASAGSFATGSGPTGVSVGDAWPGGAKAEIVVLLGGGPGAFSIYDGAGVDIKDYLLTGTSDLTPTASAIGDLLPSVGPTDTTSGEEIAVTLSSDTGDSKIEVFVQQSGGGYEPAQEYTTGSRYGTGSVILGDVDGDGVLEAVVGNAGRWAVDAARQIPSLQVFRASADGAALAPSPAFLPAGGVELAGAAPSLALADIGAGPSRHPWGSVAKAHVSTETVPSPRHVECTDCHEVHEATSTPVASTAPTAPGEIAGASGVAVTNAVGSVTLSAKSRIDYQYELCFKCHSGWVPLAGRADTAMQFNTENASFHAVEGSASTAANSLTFSGSWGNESVMYCTDCHTNADASAPKGPHTSTDAPILQRPYLGDSPADPNCLCYKCHRYDVYYTGDQDGGGSASFFSAGATKLHAAHTSGNGLGCASCHVSHGSVTQKHLIGNGTTYVETGGGGTCTSGCHPGGRSYVR